MTYTKLNCQQLDQRIDQDLSYICEKLEALPEFDDVISIILVGGYGRGEGSIWYNGDSPLPYNDYDIILITTDTRNIFKQRKFKKTLQNLSSLLEKKIGIAVDLMSIGVGKLSNAAPTLFNTEMKLGHKVLYGPPQSLFTMPLLDYSSLPEIEGLRLLMNRAMLLILLEDDLDDSYRRLRYIHKNHLAFGDALLILMHKNQLFYSDKSKVLQEIAGSYCPQEFSDLFSWYKHAVNFKVYGKKEEYTPLSNIDMYMKLRSLLPQFIYWYESQRLKKDISSLKCLKREYSKEIIKSPKDWIKSMMMCSSNLQYLGFSSFFQKPLYIAIILLIELLESKHGYKNKEKEYREKRDAFLKMRAWVG